MNEYWRGELGAAEQQAYDAMTAALLRGQEEAALPRGAQDMQACFEAVTFDHPEFYWIGSGCAVSKGFGGTKLRFQRIYSPFDVKKFDVKIEAAKDTVTRRAQGIADERELLRIVAEYLLDTVTYQIDVKMNQNAAAALCLYKAQCTGIALAAKTLLDALGVWCIAVNGEVRQGRQGGPHCWNVVRLGGTYYHFDATMMLGANGGAGGSQAQKPYRYFYLSYSDAKISATHSWSRHIPPCTDTAFDSDGLPPQGNAQPQSPPPVPPQGNAQPRQGGTRWPFSRFGQKPQTPPQQPPQTPQPQQAQSQRTAQTPPAGMKAVSSQYEIKQLFPAQPSGTFKTTFYYATEASSEKQAKLVEETIRSYYTAHGVGGTFNYSYTGKVWTVELKFEV